MSDLIPHQRALFVEMWTDVCLDLFDEVQREDGEPTVEGEDRAKLTAQLGAMCAKLSEEQFCWLFLLAKPKEELRAALRPKFRSRLAHLRPS